MQVKIIHLVKKHSQSMFGGNTGCGFVGASICSVLIVTKDRCVFIKNIIGAECQKRVYTLHLPRCPDAAD